MTAIALRLALPLVATVVAGLLPAVNGIAAERETAMAPVHFATGSGLSFYSGQALTVSEKNADAIFVAGGSVMLDGASASNLFAAGGEVSMDSVEAGDLYLAGGRLEIADVIADDVIATGGRISLRRGTTIGGDGIFAGGDVRLQPTAKGDIVVAGGKVDLGGSIDGNVTVASPSIVLHPGTRIGGDLTYRSGTELTVPDGVSIGGRVIRKDWPEASEGSGLIAGLAGAIGFLAALALLAFGALIILGSLPGRAAAELDIQPLRALGLGFAIALAVPAASILLMIMVIGIPLALFALGVYMILLGLGTITAWYWAGSRFRRILKRPFEISTLAQRLGWTTIGLVLFLDVGFIPIAGIVLQFLVVLAGVGGFTLAAWSRSTTA